MKERKDYPFHSAEEEVRSKRETKKFKLAFTDEDFLLCKELRSVRLLLEYKKAEMVLDKQNIQSTIVVCGSSRFVSKEQAQLEFDQAEDYSRKYPNDPEAEKDLKLTKKQLEMSEFYEASRQLAIRITSSKRARKEGEFVILTGGGPGIMEAANRGANENGAKSLGLRIFLPTEEDPNKFIPEELHIQFHYFAMRKMHFLARARALVFFPGGYGTLDELFETLTLIQTKKIEPIPVLLYGKAFWDKIVNFEALVEENVIAAEDLKYIEYVESVEKAWRRIKDFYDYSEFR